MSKAAAEKPLGPRRTLIWLYEGVGKWPLTFRWSILVFDMLTISYFLVSPFVGEEGRHYWLDYVIGAIITADLVARFYISPKRKRFFLRFMNIADLIVVFTMFAPLVSQNYAFLRIIRAVRIARAFSFLRTESPLARYLQLHRVLMERAINLVVFLFIMSALVYADQVAKSPDIRNYLDAFYFTVTSLTTTGYGDIELVGWTGRVLPIIIMLLGVTLFLRLLRALVTPASKAEVECTNCGLTRHERDAVHCKHCGAVVYIENEGFEP
ncbi:ion transporter [Hyphomonas polymorpha PS728]|uniref:Ion transporter n=1 Tax=Hyphomonas polymorpha PS728 TaxID=1280954 RepID=A0A062VFH9_9PROT|nr:ion transporter [Hyphomonas polymorpha]KCZ98229.1 ion transporter [Hyphomonas polymorpha PS728]